MIFRERKREKQVEVAIRQGLIAYALWGRGTEAKGKDEALLASHAPDCEPVALAAPTLRIEVRRVEELAVRARGRVSTRRPVVAVRTPTAKASRAPAIVATTRKRKRFGENTGVGSG